MTKTAATLVALVLAAAAGAASAEGPVDTQSIALAGAPSQVDRATVVAEVLQARRAGTLTVGEAGQWNLPATSTVSRVAVKSEAARANVSGEIRAAHGEVNTQDTLPTLRSRGEVVAAR